MSWNLFEKILNAFKPQNESKQPSEQSEQWPESSTEQSWQEGSSESTQSSQEGSSESSQSQEGSTEQSEASQEPFPVSQQTSCSIQQQDDSEQPKNNSDWQQE